MDDDLAREVREILATTEDQVARIDLIRACAWLTLDAPGELDPNLRLLALQRGVQLIRQVPHDHGEFPGIFESSTLRLYSELARQLIPSQEALEIADELVQVIRAGRGHVADVAEAEARRAEVVIECGDLERAVLTAQVAVRAADDVCFHDLADRIESQIALRLRIEGDLRRAEAIESRESDEIVRPTEKHVHLWDIRIGNGRVELRECADPPTSEPGGQIGSVLFPPRDGE